MRPSSLPIPWRLLTTLSPLGTLYGTVSAGLDRTRGMLRSGVVVDTIASMTTCSVLRCSEAPTGAFELIPGSRMEAPVCDGHRAALQQGASWMLHGGTGVEDPRILMGADLPQNRMNGFGVSRTVGDVPGFAIEVNIETPEGQQQVSFWTTADVGKRLGSFLTTPPAKD